MTDERISVPRRLALAACLALLVSCSHDSTPRAAPPAPSARAVDAAVAGAVKDASSRLAAGTHDYRGTLGDRTSIALHLVRSGDTLEGSYVYTSVGHPIALTGAMDPSGDVVLREGVEPRSTGTFRLKLDGPDLVGTWANPAGDKTFRLRLSPGPAWVAPVFGAGGTLGHRARACLADPMCPAAEAARLLIAADDAHDETDCYAFLDGAGTKRDLRRGRACLARWVGRRGCEPGNSPGLHVAELAVMMIDGVAGERDIQAARALFAGCLEDGTVTGVLAHADAKEADPNTPPMDFCKDNGGTTLTTNDCMRRASTLEAIKSDLAAKAVARSLDGDEAAQRLLVASTTAYEAYVTARDEYVYEANIEGTIRNAVAMNSEIELHQARAKDLSAFGAFVAAASSGPEVTRAEHALAEALAAAKPDTPAEADKFKRAQAAWVQYRDADVAFYVRVFGAKQGEARVRQAMLTRLATRRVDECAEREPGM
ncbi:MAG: lysozyme inhibitor LprI family protein [Polyangiaceae bacterium]